MPSSKLSRSTGPISKQGKARASLNAVKHGLTSSRILPEEKEIVDSYVRELVDYYKTQSPLELLQIQRIAFCRAKLQRLINIEYANRKIIQHKIENHPELVMKKLSQYSLELKFLAEQAIAGNPVCARLGLQKNELPLMAEESERLIEEGDLAEFGGLYPVTSNFVHRFFGLNNGFDYIQMFICLNKFIEMYKNIASVNLSEDKDLSAFDKALYKIAADSRADSDADFRRMAFLPAGGKVNLIYLRDILKEVSKILKNFLLIDSVIKEFEEMKEWMIEAIELDSQDADRMMKYQTMLERRLSTAIGELLELQRHRLKLASAH